MSVLERLEIIRKDKHLNKSQFEKVLGKSTGYINTLNKNNSIPGTEVIIKISDNYPEINLNWLLKGEGDMRKGAEGQLEADLEEPRSVYGDVLSLHRDLKKDLATLSEGMTYNFEVVGRGVMQTLKDQQKLLKFIEQLDVDKIKKASAGLDEFLKEKK